MDYEKQKAEMAVKSLWVFAITTYSHWHKPCYSEWEVSEVEMDEGEIGSLVWEIQNEAANSYSQEEEECCECGGSGEDEEGDECNHCDGQGYYVPDCREAWNEHVERVTSGYFERFDAKKHKDVPGAKEFMTPTDRHALEVEEAEALLESKNGQLETIKSRVQRMREELERALDVEALLTTEANQAQEALDTLTKEKL